MWEDPIVKEIREIRKAHAARFDYDLRAIYQDLKKQEKKSGRKVVSYPARKYQPVRRTARIRNP